MAREVETSRRVTSHRETKTHELRDAGSARLFSYFF